MLKHLQPTLSMLCVSDRTSWQVALLCFAGVPGKMTLRKNVGQHERKEHTSKNQTGSVSVLCSITWQFGSEKLQGRAPMVSSRAAGEGFWLVEGSPCTC